MNEIEAVSQDYYKGGEDDLGEWRHDLNKEIFVDNLRPTSDPDILYYVQQKNVPRALIDNDADYLFALADAKTKKLIAILTLGKERITNRLNGYSVNTITVSEHYRGKRLSSLLYLLALKKYGLILISGHQQTPGGRRNWKKLNEVPGVQVVGLIELSSNDENRVTIKDLVPIGKMGRANVYIFNVFPGPEQLRSLAQQIKLYGDDVSIADASMIAVYKG